jgi:hypothetical protein
MSNLDEYGADTDPLDAQALLAIRGLHAASNAVMVEWTGGAKATQFLERCTTLADTSTLWQAIHTNLPPTPSASSHGDSGLPGPPRYYRVRASR